LLPNVVCGLAGDGFCFGLQTLAGERCAFYSWLQKNQVPVTDKLTNSGHEWSLWRNYLEGFLPLTFR
jgi:hypothetical protein